MGRFRMLAALLPRLAAVALILAVVAFFALRKKEPQSAASGPAAATKETPQEKWVDRLEELFSNPNSVSSQKLSRLPDGSRVEVRDGIVVIAKPLKDAAVRVTMREVSEQVSIHLRQRQKTGTFLEGYAAQLRKDGDLEIRCYRAESGQILTLAKKRIPGLDLQKSHTLEFRAVGDLLTVSVDGTKLIEAQDSTYTEGKSSLTSSVGGIIAKLEYLIFDSSPAKDVAPSVASDPPAQLATLTSAPAAVSPVQASKSSPATAAKDAPFVNSIGMKFVPVPIGSGPTKDQRVLFSVWDTRGEAYEVYAKAQETAGQKVDGSWKTQNKDSVPVGHEKDHPVVGVNWEDAQAFCQWLTAKETAEGKLPQGLKYRLPTDEEWSWAVGLPEEKGATPEEKNGKNTSDFPWGKDWPPTGKAGNYADETFHAKFPKPDAKDSKTTNGWIEGDTDGYETTSPVGSFPANAHGLYDMGGNVWQWCEDWWNTEHQERVLRGASWLNHERNFLRSSSRSHYAPTYRIISRGFRCVLAASLPATSAVTLAPAPAAPAK